MNPPESGFESPFPQERESSVTITRAELYEKVWSAPMVNLAKEFGISDRGLAKTIDALVDHLGRVSPAVFFRREHLNQLAAAVDQSFER
jgi:hypothetical protein